jgi:phenylacetic acid degradation operon negative regulatory protein
MIAGRECRRMESSAARPVVSRRREVSHASARSLLMTVLGEFVLPRDRPVWTSTLVDVLGCFEIEEKSARQALARTASEGWLTSERLGRRVRWSLSAPGRRLLREGAHRIYHFGTDRHDWDGRWLMVLASVPEATRDLRHRLKTQLSWIGFGSPATGVWVSPDPSREPRAREILAELGIDGEAMSFVAGYGTIGDEDALVARSWQLDELEERYEHFIAQFTGLAPASGEETLRAQTRLVHEWRRFPFLDPQLPVRLLPATWSGNTAAELFHARHAEWRTPAQAHWSHLTTPDRT